MSYQHTQIGRLMVFTFIAIAIYFGYLLSEFGLEPILGTTMFLILFIIASFAALSVTVDEKKLRVKFGYGIFKKSFDIKKISSAKVVRNPWYFGWGIRVWFWPYMWIFNVSGFDAVEIKMQSGKIYRIGTDEPEELERAISQAVSHKPI